MKQKPETSAPRLSPLGDPRSVRFYRHNELALQSWVERLGDATGLTLVELLRDCVDAGLPTVEARLRNAVGKA